MEPRLYHDLVPWYRLIDPPEDHRDEVASYQAALERGCVIRPQTLLELGAGAGHNAYHLKHRFTCTLSEPSAKMQGLSRELNPECEHIGGDMRELRLHRLFDTVLVHDAVMYMRSEDDLLAAARTAFTHTRPGGAAVFAPDCLADTFSESTHLLEGQAGDRAIRGLEWSWDPDPTDTTFFAEYSFLLRDGKNVQAVHDRHIVGLFSRATWQRILQEAGFTSVEFFDRPLDDEGGFDQVLLARYSPAN